MSDRKFSFAGIEFVEEPKLEGGYWYTKRNEGGVVHLSSTEYHTLYTTLRSLVEPCLRYEVGKAEE